MEIIIFILSIFLIASLYLNWNLFSKLEAYENIFESYDEFLSKKALAYKQLLEKMREIDSRQIFEKDDDVGSTFQGIKELIEDYKNFE
jgi:type III secretory pathway component EscR